MSLSLSECFQCLLSLSKVKVTWMVNCMITLDIMECRTRMNTLVVNTPPPPTVSGNNPFSPLHTLFKQSPDIHTFPSLSLLPEFLQSDFVSLVLIFIDLNLGTFRTFNLYRKIEWRRFGLNFKHLWGKNEVRISITLTHLNYFFNPAIIREAQV